MTTRTTNDILWEGPCAYAVPKGNGYEVHVHSSNYTTHVSVGWTDNRQRAERTCIGLNNYPRQTRETYGLL